MKTKEELERAFKLDLQRRWAQGDIGFFSNLGASAKADDKRVPEEIKKIRDALNANLQQGITMWWIKSPLQKTEVKADVNAQSTEGNKVNVDNPQWALVCKPHQKPSLDLPALSDYAGTLENLFSGDNENRLKVISCGKRGDRGYYYEYREITIVNPTTLQAKIDKVLNKNRELKESIVVLDMKNVVIDGASSCGLATPSWEMSILSAS
jgi:hypothetical protein